MRKILYISGTRADYGPMVSVLKAVRNHPALSLSVLVTGMHLSKEFGYTINEIKKDNFEIEAEIPILNLEDSGASMACAFGKQVSGFAKKIKKIKPDIILLEGDRGEMLAGAIAGRYLGVVIAHASGGDRSSGSMIDDSMRHAITKLAHIHFPGTEKSANRIIKMGEDPRRVYLVGDPGNDYINNMEIVNPLFLSKKFNLDLKKPIILVLQHSVSNESEKASYQMRETLEALVKLKYQAVIIYPNADAGGRAMIKIIEKYKKYAFIKIYPHLPHNDFLNLMKVSNVMVGNSSSGIIEAPIFNLPVVNIGTRELGRESARNIVCVGYNRNSIKKAIKMALTRRKLTKKNRNPYISKNVGQKIADILAKIKIDKKLLEKNLTY